MSRKKRQNSIETLQNAISLIMNQCSLSENDANFLNQAMARLQKLRFKKGLTDKQYVSEVSDIVDLISKFLI